MVKKCWKSQGILSVWKSGDHVVSMRKFVFTRSEWFLLFFFLYFLVLVQVVVNVGIPVRKHASTCP